MNDHNIYTFDPDHVGKMIAKSHWEGCWEYLGQILENMTMGAGGAAMMFSLQLQKDMQDEKQKEYVKNFGALLGELLLYLLTADSVGMSDKSFYHLIFYHETLHSIFDIYNLDNTDEHIEKILSQKKLNPDSQKKLLILVSINTSLNLNEILKSVAQSYRIAAIVAYMGHRKSFKEKAYNNKVKLYELRSELRRTYEQEKTLMQTVHAYFHSSYIKIPNKHIIKEDINASIRQHLAGLIPGLKRMLNVSKSIDYGFDLDLNKPTVLVVNEYFTRNHAMYRGWGRVIKSLESEFNIVLITQMSEPDSVLRSEYKNIISINTFGDLYHISHMVKPDIIFMPSIGMRLFNILASNIRLAPIQIMGLGHPATTMSDKIDYVVSPKGLYDERAFPTDIFIADGYPEKHAPLVNKDVFFAPDRGFEKEKNKTVLRIGVVGTDIKVSYPFFSLLKEMVAESPYKIHVSFMMGVGGIDSLYIEKYLKENFENSTYYGWQPYLEYLENLKTIDIVLNSFPFGHTNTIIDTLMCGKPCVGLEDIEPSSKTEKDVLDAVGLKDQFIAQTEEEYKSKFSNLAKKIMSGETVFFDRDKVYDRIFAELGDYDYGKIMKWIYDHHSELKSSGKKFYEVFQEL